MNIFYYLARRISDNLQSFRRKAPCSAATEKPGGKERLQQHILFQLLRLRARQRKL